MHISPVVIVTVATGERQGKERKGETLTDVVGTCVAVVDVVRVLPHLEQLSAPGQRRTRASAACVLSAKKKTEVKSEHSSTYMMGAPM